MTEATSVVDLLTRGGLLSALVIALIGGMRGWYIWGTQHREIVASKDKTHQEAIQEKNTQIDDLRKDRDYWREQAIRALSTTGRAVGVVEASTRRMDP